MDGKRSVSIDMAKGLGILMITYGHITELSNPVDHWMSLFKITLFYIVAGYLMSYTGAEEKYTGKQFVLKTLRTIMLPYVSFSVVIIIVKAVAAWFRHKDVLDGVFTNLYATLTLRGVNTLWFLPTLAIGEILFFFILKSRKKSLFWILITASLIAGYLLSIFTLNLKDTLGESAYQTVSYPLHPLAKSLVAIWFIGIGYAGQKIVAGMGKAVKYPLGLLLTVLTIVMGAAVSRGIDFNMLVYGRNPVWFLIGGITGTFGALFLFELLQERCIAPFLSYWGRNSLILMATQRCLLLVNLSLGAVKQVLGIEKALCFRYYAQTLIALLIVLMLAYAVIAVIDHSRFLSFCFTGKRAENRKA